MPKKPMKKPKPGKRVGTSIKNKGEVQRKKVLAARKRAAAKRKKK